MSYLKPLVETLEDILIPIPEKKPIVLTATVKSTYAFKSLSAGLPTELIKFPAATPLTFLGYTAKAEHKYSMYAEGQDGHLKKTKVPNMAVIKAGLSYNFGVSAPANLSFIGCLANDPVRVFVESREYRNFMSPEEISSVEIGKEFYTRIVMLAILTDSYTRLN